jgi:hypothetical protein
MNQKKIAPAAQPAPPRTGFAPGAGAGAPPAWPRRPGEHFITEWAVHHAADPRHGAGGAP